VSRVDELYRLEYEALQSKWEELFENCPTPEADAILDASHPPPGLGRMIAEVQTELMEKLEALGEEGDDDDTRVMRLFTASMNALSFMTVRFYRLGGAMAWHMPYENMTPCRCTVAHDEELNDLLSEGFPLDGDGWVIQNFVPRRES
jgi:hypothetical protein